MVEMIEKLEPSSRGGALAPAPAGSPLRSRAAGRRREDHIVGASAATRALVQAATAAARTDLAGADRGPGRERQGARRARDPQLGPARGAALRGALVRRAARGAAAPRALRLRRRRVPRAAGRARRRPRPLRRRHARARARRSPARRRPRRPRARRRCAQLSARGQLGAAAPAKRASCAPSTAQPEPLALRRDLHHHEIRLTAARRAPGGHPAPRRALPLGVLRGGRLRAVGFTAEARTSLLARALAGRRARAARARAPGGAPRAGRRGRRRGSAARPRRRAGAFLQGGEARLRDALRREPAAALRRATSAARRASPRRTARTSTT